MRTFSIEGGKNSPRVYMNEADNFVEISGISTLKETNWFYSNLFKWMVAFNKGDGRTARVNIRLQRINDSSSQWIRLIFKKLALLFPGLGVEINIYHSGESQRVLMCAQFLQTETNYKVNMLSQ